MDVIFDDIFCPDCHKFYPISDLKIIDGMAKCPGSCRRIFLLGNIELTKEDDRERRT